MRYQTADLLRTDGKRFDGPSRICITEGCRTKLRGGTALRCADCASRRYRAASTARVASRTVTGSSYSALRARLDRARRWTPGE